MLKNKLVLISIFCFFQNYIYNAAQAQTGKSIKTIVVDAGHGGQDAGATGQYENSLRSKEKDVTLDITLKLVAELKKQLPNVNIVPTRTSDIYQDPREKARDRKSVV